MSGLGVGPFKRQQPQSRQQLESSQRSSKTIRASKRESKPLAPPPIASKPSKIRNFFGQRPPSELINTNLADFFPSTDSKALQRTARRSIYGRASASTRSKRNSTWSFVADPDAPPLPNKESQDGHDTPPERSSVSIKERSTPPVIQIGYDSRSEDERPSNAPRLSTSSQMQSQQTVTGAPMLPPVVDRDSARRVSRDLKAVAHRC